MTLRKVVFWLHLLTGLTAGAVILINLADEVYFDQVHPWHVVPGAARTTGAAGWAGA